MKGTKGLFWLGMVALALAFMVLAGCYTMGHTEKEDVTIQASKTGVAFELLDGKGAVIARGETPYMVQLNAQSFNKAYTIKFTGADGEEHTENLKGKFKFKFWWLVVDFGGAIVPVVVDAATGKMFYMPSSHNLQVSYQPNAGQQIMIATLDDVRPEMRQYLVPMPEDSYQFTAE